MLDPHSQIQNLLRKRYKTSKNSSYQHKSFPPSLLQWSPYSIDTNNSLWGPIQTLQHLFCFHWNCRCRKRSRGSPVSPRSIEKSAFVCLLSTREHHDRRVMLNVVSSPAAVCCRYGVFFLSLQHRLFVLPQLLAVFFFHHSLTNLNNNGGWLVVSCRFHAAVRGKWQENRRSAWTYLRPLSSKRIVASSTKMWLS